MFPDICICRCSTAICTDFAGKAKVVVGSLESTVFHLLMFLLGLNLELGKLEYILDYVTVHVLGLFMASNQIITNIDCAQLIYGYYVLSFQLYRTGNIVRWCVAFSVDHVPTLGDCDGLIHLYGWSY